MSNTVDRHSAIFSSIYFLLVKRLHFPLPSTDGLHLHTRQRSSGLITFVGVFWMEWTEHVNTQIWQIPSHVRKPFIQLSNYNSCRSTEHGSEIPTACAQRLSHRSFAPSALPTARKPLGPGWPKHCHYYATRRQMTGLWCFFIDLHRKPRYLAPR